MEFNAGDRVRFDRKRAPPHWLDWRYSDREATVLYQVNKSVMLRFDGYPYISGDKHSILAKYFELVAPLDPFSQAVQAYIKSEMVE